MIRRTTLAAEADDIGLLEQEARRRRVSLAVVLREVVAEAAEVRRAQRPKPHLGVFAGNQKVTGSTTADDEAAPARGRLRS
jgi:hypothetical protein